MIPELLQRKLAGGERPADRAALEKELAQARAKGYKVPDIDYANAVITVEQARAALARLGLGESGLFGAVMSAYRHFPPGAGAELLELEEILEIAQGQAWDAEYPGFSQRFLPLTSSEGEGSYFFEKSSGRVFDADWGAMQALMQGGLAPRWESYADFLGWYYGMA